MSRTYDPEVFAALTTLREVARRNQAEIKVVQAINTLDDADVFSRLDELAEYDEAGVHDPAVCTAHPLDGPSLHSGTCPVWAAHHNLV